MDFANQLNFLDFPLPLLFCCPACRGYDGFCIGHIKECKGSHSVAPLATSFFSGYLIRWPGQCQFQAQTRSDKQTSIICGGVWLPFCPNMFEVC